MPAAVEDETLECCFESQQVVRWAEIGDHRFVFVQARAIAAYRGDQITPLLVAAGESRNTDGYLQRLVLSLLLLLYRFLSGRISARVR